MTPELVTMTSELVTMTSKLQSLWNIDVKRFDKPDILKKLSSASRALAELKGVAATIPNQEMLINTLGLQEAKDSSEIENIVTTHDELYRELGATELSVTSAAKEVARYRFALDAGYRAVVSTKLLTTNILIEVQRVLEQNEAGLRKVPGTRLKDSRGNVVYTPPQNAHDIERYMQDLEQYVNGNGAGELDPLIKMALIHHQFESIHPFYDGNGRCGRILCVLYLVKKQLLNIPVLYLSRYIVLHKAEYYRLLQAVRERDAWEDWVLFMLTAVEQTSREALVSIDAIRTLFMEYKRGIRATCKFYSQDLLNNIFFHVYTKIEFLQNELGVSRLTATKYLEALCAEGFLVKRKIGKTNYYINHRLYTILTQ